MLNPSSLWMRRAPRTRGPAVAPALRRAPTPATVAGHHPAGTDVPLQSSGRRGPTPPTTAAAEGRARTSAAHRPNVRTDADQSSSRAMVPVERERRHRALTTHRPRPRMLLPSAPASAATPSASSPSARPRPSPPHRGAEDRLATADSALPFTAPRVPAVANPRHRGRSATPVPTFSSTRRA